MSEKLECFVRKGGEGGEASAEAGDEEPIGAFALSAGQKADEQADEQTTGEVDG